MITIRHSYFITRRIKEAWLQMDNLPDVSPYMYYDFMKYVFWQTKLFKHWKPIIYYGIDETETIVFIAPMRLLKNTREIDTLGNIPQCDIADFLYASNVQDKRLILEKLCKYIGQPFTISRFMANSCTLENLRDKATCFYTHDCVNIGLPDDFETYISSLSKSVRQNIRTSYNRLNRDNIDIDLKMFFGNSFPKADIPNDHVYTKLTRKFKTDTKQCYESRQLNLYYKEDKSIARLLLVKYLRHDNYSLFYNNNSVVAGLYLNGKLAACFMGMIDKSNTTIVIPRLASDMNYKFYSPGYILLCEVSKYLIKHTKVRNLDLCRGTEKYKLDLGGKIYTTEYHKIN